MEKLPWHRQRTVTTPQQLCVDTFYFGKKKKKKIFPKPYILFFLLMCQSAMVMLINQSKQESVKMSLNVFLPVLCGFLSYTPGAFCLLNTVNSQITEHGKSLHFREHFLNSHQAVCLLQYSLVLERILATNMSNSCSSKMPMCASVHPSSKRGCFIMDPEMVLMLLLHLGA